MPIHGCPDQKLNKWLEGYINITFPTDYNLREMRLGVVSQKGYLFTLGPFGKRSYQLNFCIKSSTKNDASDRYDNNPDWLTKESTQEWPRGTYAIYKTTSSECPHGEFLKSYKTKKAVRDWI